MYALGAVYHGRFFSPVTLFNFDPIVVGLTVSSAPGPAGNIESLIWLRRNAGPSIEADSAISTALVRADGLRKKC